MSKYTRHYPEIKEHWDTNIEFIKSSVINFDNGNEKEARRIALALRILFHETARSKSIYNQIDGKLAFKSAANIYSPANLVSSWNLLALSMGPEGIKYIPNLDQQTRNFYMMFEDWWHEIIFDDKKNLFSRKDIILFVANKDGGAHLDPEIPEKYAQLEINNSLGFTDENGNKPQNNPIYQSIRVIAQEVMDSLELCSKGNLLKSVQNEHKVEMRYRDASGNERYPWSSTEFTYSVETAAIVEKDKKSKRRLYNLKYGSMKSVSFIGE
ncbi:hypothetical protein SIN07_06705 [Pediococcus inopinatus]|uniref:hypothetical protein n=1 Tax=Pediococcus TaxID=1253 RepID=UPI002A6B41CB|nr:hypothetical protein [Pediococcus inopinatus]WPC18749.1 hypothetical protein N6G95_05635 [Pediococcus inopinatus]WPP08702.1 hypothetical protein SIN07_06705 [Pediococcus inopinatus]